MFRRSNGVKERVAGAAESLIEYVDPLAKDGKLKKRLAAAVAAGAAAQQEVRRQTGVGSLARRLARDRVLRDQLRELAAQLEGATKRARKARSHRVRNTILFVGGIGLVVAAVPSLREAVASKLGGTGDDWAPSPGWDSTEAPKLNEEQATSPSGPAT
jgi:signal transduction protein with GAF and PtsI domain